MTGQTKEASTVDHARAEAAVEQIVSSAALRNSESLCRLIRFLVEHKLQDPDTHLKEHEIATRLLGRRHDFDARLDPVVRVQIGRLRSKLVEYYATQGATDDLVIQIPRGSYAPRFLARAPQIPSGSGDMTAPARYAVHRAGGDVPKRRLASPRWILPGAVLMLFLLGTGWYVGAHSPGSEEQRTRSLGPHLPSALDRLWAPFVTGPEPPLVVLNDAIPVSGSRSERGYTGVGEVFAVSALHRCFARMEADLKLQWGQSLKWDGTGARPAILLGPGFGHLSSRKFDRRQKYVLEERYGASGREVLIRNVMPEPGEPAAYRPDLRNADGTDYALITRTAGTDGTPLLMLAGTTTLGTQAAVEFATTDSQVSALESALRGLPASFTALLSVDIRGGVPVRSRIISAAAFQDRQARNIPGVTNRATY